MNFDDIDDLREVDEPSTSKEAEQKGSTREENLKKLRDKRRSMQNGRKGGGGNKMAQLTGKAHPGNMPAGYQNLMNSLMGDVDMQEMLDKLPPELKDSKGRMKTDKGALMAALANAKKRDDKKEKE